MKPANPYILEVSTGSISWFSWAPVVIGVIAALVMGAVIAFLLFESRRQVVGATCLSLIVGVLVGLLVSSLINDEKNSQHHENAPEQALVQAWPHELGPEITVSPVDLARGSTLTVQRANLPDCVVTRREGKYYESVQTFTLECDGKFVKPVINRIDVP